MNRTSQSIPRARRLTRGQRTAYASSVTFLATCLGFTAVLISFLVGTVPRLEPAHLEFAPSVIFGAAGALAAIAMAAPVSYMLGKVRPPRNWQVCFVWGLAFGLLLPVITGALLPSSVVVMDWNRDLISAGGLLSELLSAQFRAPLNSFVYTSLNITTGLIFGAVFGLGFWVINRLTLAANLAVSRYGPWIFAFTLGATAVSLASYGPTDALTRLG